MRAQDEHEVVQQVQEFYADFVPINHELFSLNVPSVTGLSGAAWDQAVFDRVHQGVCAALLGLKKRPVVRYQANSEMAMRLAESTLGTMDTEGELFGFRRPAAPPLPRRRRAAAAAATARRLCGRLAPHEVLSHEVVLSHLRGG